jgi:S1-C subfamily serine protease
VLVSLTVSLAPQAACAGGDAASPPGPDPALRAAVVRVEAALDPASFGPDFAADLAGRQPWTPYEAEIARRLRVGSTGTGFFVNSEGDLVTNAHVVLSGVRYRGLHFTHAEWDSMAILLSLIRDIWVTVGVGEDARTYLATPVTIAEDLDLAVLRVTRPPGDATEFTPLLIAPSAPLRVGDPVQALGFPEDKFQTASGAILSLIRGVNVHEEMQIVRQVAPATGEETITVSGTTAGPVVRFQHSAPTGHGSSGGPVIDPHGRVIGVAYALLAQRSPDSENSSPTADLNLAITSDVLKRFLAYSSVAFTEAGT